MCILPLFNSKNLQFGVSASSPFTMLIIRADIPVFCRRYVIYHLALYIFKPTLTCLFRPFSAKNLQQFVSEGRIPCSTGAGGVGSIPANPDAQNVPSFRRWRFEMKLSPFFFWVHIALGVISIFWLAFSRSNLFLVHYSAEISTGPCECKFMHFKLKLFSSWLNVLAGGTWSWVQACT